MDSLIDKLLKTDAYYLYDDGFLEFIEMNMSNLRKQSQATSTVIDIDKSQKSRADRNFNLLCNLASIPFHLHWLTLRLNGYKEYSEYRSTDEPIYMLDLEYLSKLKLLYDESQRNS